MVGPFQLRLCGGAKHHRGMACRRKKIHRQIKQRQQVCRDGLHLINNDNAVRQRLKPPDAGGFPAEQGVQQLHQCGYHNGRRPLLTQHLPFRLPFQLLGAYYIGMMLQNKALIRQRPPDHGGILIQDRKQTGGQNNA